MEFKLTFSLALRAFTGFFKAFLNELQAACEAEMIDAMTELMTATDAGGDRLVRARAMFRMAGTYAAESAMSIVDMLAIGAGAESIFETSPLERAARDVRAAARHIAVSPGNYVVGGRMALGLDPGTARF